MAFGIDPKLQRPGDVLVSNSLIPYDRPDIHPDRSSWWPRFRGKYIVNYRLRIATPQRSLCFTFFDARWIRRPSVPGTCWFDSLRQRAESIAVVSETS